MSEFQPYGSGVVNYFKFIKWSGWLFTMLFLVSLPVLVFNIYGPNHIDRSNMNALARTTFGNLLPYNESDTSQIMHIPGTRTAIAHGDDHTDSIFHPRQAATVSR